MTKIFSNNNNGGRMVSPFTVKILQDSPASEDAFEGKGHQRTADALADAIDQLEDRDGAIGLEGSWGAGKSTVINLAEKRLKERNTTTKKYEIFTFDLWAHQSDDFRRAFLEAFVAWLDEKKFLSKERLNLARDSIRDRVKAVKVESSKKYNTFGIAFALILPILPFIYAWLSPAALKPTIPGGESSTPLWLMITAVTLIAGLYAGVIARLIHLSFDWGKWWIRRTGRSFTDALSNSISIFSRDVESETTTQNIRESDPTTIEFHGIFRELLSEVQAHGNCIIHVLDNIDRLPKAFVQGTWSEVRALFAIRGRPTPRQHDNVLVVLPYDKRFVMDAFDVKPTDERADAEADFIEKTFSRTLRVAPPISNDWRSFFFNKLTVCFGNSIELDVSERLFRLLRYSFQKSSTHPSPRRIIHFVNELGALDAQWRRSISLEACAVYLLNRKNIEKDSAALQRPNLIEERYSQIANVDDLTRQLAALTFNVEPEFARQVLLQSPISKAIVAESATELQSLSKIEGFLDVFQDVLQDSDREWLSQESPLLERVCTNIASIDFDEVAARASWRDVTRDIHSLSEPRITSPDLTKALSLAIVGVCDSQEALKLASKLRSLISSLTIEKMSDLDARFKYGNHWFLSLTHIYKALEEAAGREVAGQFLNATSLVSDADFVLGAAYQCSQSADYLLCETFTNTCDSSLIDGVYNFLIAKNAPWALEIVDQIEGYFSENGLKDALNVVLKKLQTTPLIGDEDQPAREALLALSVSLKTKINDPGFIKISISPLVTDSTLFWHGYHAYQAGNHNAAADAIGLLASQQNIVQPFAVSDPHPNFGAIGPAANWYGNLMINGINDNVLLELLVARSADYMHFESWRIRGLIENNNATAYKQILIRIIGSLNFHRLDIYETLIDYPKIKAIVDIGPAIKYLRKLAEWSQRFSVLEADEKLLKLPSEVLIDIYAHASDTNLTLILTLIDKRISIATQAEWTTALLQESDLLRIFIIRRQDSEVTPILKEYRPALLDHLFAVVQGKAIPHIYANNWDNVVDGLPPNNQTTVANEALIALADMSITDDGIVCFIGCYRKLTDLMKYENHPDTSLNQIFSKVIMRLDAPSVSFIDAKVQKINTVLEKASPEARGAFEESIQSLELTENANGQERAKLLKDLFEIIDIPKEEE
jgi:hypothetical protein